MSGSKEKRKRQEEREIGKEKRQVKTAKQMEEKKKSDRKVAIIGSIIALFVVVVLVFSSNLFYRNFSAVKVNDESFTVTDYGFFYYTTYNNYYASYYQSYGDLAKYLMPDDATIKSETLSRMEEVVMLCSQAESNNYTISDEGQANIDAAIAGLADTAEQNNYASVKAYLVAVYGKGMNEKIFKENYEKYALAADYSDHVLNSYVYTDDQLDENYSENKDSYDYFNYRYFFFDGSAVEDDTTTEADETVDSATAMANAKALADEFVGKVTDEKSFADLAYEYAGEDSKADYEDDSKTLGDTQGSKLSSDYSEWLLDSSRVEGDKTVVETSTGYYVLYYISRDDNNYKTIDVRHILIKPAEVSEDDYDDDTLYQAAVKAANATALTEAESIYEQWKSGAADEASFAALADEYSDDSAVGGLYEKVYQGMMVDAFNDWCFDSSRKTGDTDIVETDYGYHIMYYIGKDMLYSRYLADQSLRNNEYNSWATSMISSYTVNTTWLLKLAK